MTLEQAWNIVNAVVPFDLPAALTAAQQVVEALGELPEPMHYQLGYRAGRSADEQIAAWHALSKLRPAGAPPYSTVRI